MTKQQIRYSIETQELQLKFWHKVTHYGLPIFFFLIPLMLIAVRLKGYIDGTVKEIIYVDFWIVLIPVIPGLLFYRIQRNRLKLKAVKTQLSREEVGTIVDKVGKELEWYPYLMDKDIIIAKTHPGFWSGSWGEQITILFDQHRILINSICDPDERSSVVSMGRNKQNENKLIAEIKKANIQSSKQPK